MPSPTSTGFYDSPEDLLLRNESLRSLRELLNDHVVEKNLENFPLFVIASKTYKLTFFDQRDVNIQENLYEAEICKYLRSLPPSRHSPELYLKVGQTRMIFHANLRRSLGTNDRNKMNERIIQQTQFKQLMSGDNTPVKPGFFRRMFGK
jgi:hypothetical protein